MLFSKSARSKQRLARTKKLRQRRRSSRPELLEARQLLTTLATDDAREGIAALLEKKKVNRLGILAQNLHHRGLQYGPDFSTLYDLPAVEDSQAVADDTIYADYHETPFPFGGEWEADSRLCLQGQSPRPATLLAAIAEMESVTRRRSR